MRRRLLPHRTHRQAVPTVSARGADPFQSGRDKTVHEYGRGLDGGARTGNGVSRETSPFAGADHSGCPDGRFRSPGGLRWRRRQWGAGRASASRRQRVWQRSGVGGQVYGTPVPTSSVDTGRRADHGSDGATRRRRPRSRSRTPRRSHRRRARTRRGPRWLGAGLAPPPSRHPSVPTVTSADEHVSRETPSRDEDDPPLGHGSVACCADPQSERRDHHAASRPSEGALRREPEGRRRQDHHDREPRRGAGAARQPRTRGRPGPAGQRVHRPQRAAPRGRAGRVRLPDRQRAAVRGRAAGRGHSEPVLRAGDHRPGRRGDRAGLGGGARVAAGRARSRRTRRSSTTSSSTARRRSAC